MHIQGHVKDTTEQKSLINATAVVIRIKDSVMLNFQHTDRNGNFSFDLPIDTVELRVSHYRFGDNSYYLFGSEGNHEFDIKQIILPPKSQQLKEVVIYAYKDPVYFKGDTLVYVADSFPTKPNDVVEDLLKKLPGIKVNPDGTIQAQGKDIQQVLVDGDEFFGADPTMATRNLGSKGIKTVEIYEKRDENATDDTETIQVLDLRLKDEAKKGYFGKLSFGSDAQRYYEGEFLANKFDKKQKISVFLLSSNTMKSSLAWRDMYQYGMASWNRGGSRNMGSNNGTGIPNTFKTGVYFNDQLTKKMELGFNYTYSKGGVKTNNFNRSQYFFADTSYVTDLESMSNSQNESHELNLKVTHKLDSLTTLEFEPQLSFNKSNATESNRTDFLFENLNLSRYTLVQHVNEAEGMTFNARVGLIKNFKKKDRKLTSSYRYTYDKNTSLGQMLIEDSTVVVPTALKVDDQQKNGQAKSLSHRAQISYLEPLNKNWKLELSYDLYANDDEQEKLTYVARNGVYDSLVNDFSNQFESLKLQHRVGTELIYHYKKHRVSAGLNARNVVIKNHNFFLDTTINQRVNNLLPTAHYIYRISKHNRLTLNYNTSSAQPSVSQLQPVNDNSNPNRVLQGNPDLKPTFVHSFAGSYNSYKPLSGIYIWSSINHSITQNAFASSLVYDPDGRTVSSTINVNGNTYSSFNFGGGFSLFKKVLEISPSLNLSYSKNLSEVNKQLNTTINRNLGGGLEFTVEGDNLEISIAGNYDYTAPSTSLSSQTSLPYASQSFEANLEWDLPFNIYFETDLEYTMNLNRADGYNVNFAIWNASLAKNFLKSENLILAIDVYDILGQNISADRYVSDNVITDSRSTIITRYFLGRVTYKFNSTKKIKSDDDF